LRKQNIWKYINIGTGFRYLQEAKKGRSIHGDSFILENIERFSENLEELGLPVTSRAAYDLGSLYEELLETDEDAKLTEEQAKALRDAIMTLRPTFAAEARGIFSYIVNEKRISTEKLVGDITSIFSPDVFDKISDIAQYDFKEAGRCVAFERPTAAAFHLMRAVESVLKPYYKKYTRPAQNGLTWGQMTHALKNKQRGKKPNPTTLNQVDHIRVAFRNPTQHPEKIYDIEEAQDLLFLCIDVTNRMVSEIHNK